MVFQNIAQLTRNCMQMSLNACINSPYCSSIALELVFVLDSGNEERVNENKGEVRAKSVYGTLSWYAAPPSHSTLTAIPPLFVLVFPLLLITG